MRWHPATRVGVVVLGNRTYFPAADIAERMLRSLVRAGAAPIRRLARAPALETAMDAIGLLLASWDAALAAGTFSMNVDLDEPVERRRAEFERLRQTHGALRRSSEEPTSDTPMHALWWMEGEPGRGRVKVEITVDPQAVPKVQWLDLTSVPEPGPGVRAAAEALVEAVNDPSLPLPSGERLDRAAAERDVLLVRTLFGTIRLSAPIAGDGTRVTFEVAAERGKLDLEVAVDAEGEIVAAKWTPRPVSPPPFEVR